MARPRTLVVEDHLLNRELVVDLVEEAGYVLKDFSPADLVKAVREVAEGRRIGISPLSERAIADY